ncbi:MAG: bifunctional hydroxymethylpyrimidine kinase/phosphomethylpyrimidine kinase [Lunatimonas sp.]|uniref:bifunctional hydroxymethylpyrimidine kinase/phosphomethylpyrimidine kinase n=1 Tax=Lunatimonas sp. TaxID=2060141 RepID=UPI00263BD3C4|nr:bifunctional hydroxymethylpyrimidine kinase/phosphomethylpyrimidine kinase [Lunatimonas sp.]MCC5937291.1 bifunctional hydroxymethylpyrimidine kinase/phosphomethylpyrimidine kinase [Lunatimonas sp.]
MVKRYKSVLTIAGSDSGGGAGIQADIKTISALGCYATSVITAVTAQNTVGVRAIHPIPIDVIKAQLDAVMEDILPDAIKIGMLDRPAVVQLVADCLDAYPDIPVVLDPVMVATSGDRLIAKETVSTLVDLLFPRAALVTPNLDEAALLIKRPIREKNELLEAALDIFDQGANGVLVKGGHLKGEVAADLLLWGYNRHRLFEKPFIQTQNGHGTGCTLSSAIAVELALGADLELAVAQASEYVWQALYAGKDVVTGRGQGPLNHFHTPIKLTSYELDS